MDEASILDMDELAIEHSQLDFQDEVKKALGEAGGTDAKHRKKPKRKLENGASERQNGSEGAAVVPNVAVVSSADLLESFHSASLGNGLNKRNGTLTGTESFDLCWSMKGFQENLSEFLVCFSGCCVCPPCTKAK